MYEHRKIRVAPLAYFHYTKASAGQLKDVFVRASERADVLAVCGDMTDYGLPEMRLSRNQSHYRNAPRHYHRFPNCCASRGGP